MGIPVMPGQSEEKCRDQIPASMDILLHAKSKISTSDSF